MALTKYHDFRDSEIKALARKILIAAKTAPKGRGLDNLEMAIVDGEDIEKLASKMEEIGKENPQGPFLRDAGNLRQTSCVILIGTKISPAGLKKCGLCGFSSCEEKMKNPKTPCVFNITDLGIALGSAVSIAADSRLDNRIMYSVGYAAIELGLLEDAKIAYGIPLSATTKSPYFDRPAPK